MELQINSLETKTEKMQEMFNIFNIFIFRRNKKESIKNEQCNKWDQKHSGGNQE